METIGTCFLLSLHFVRKVLYDDDMGLELLLTVFFLPFPPARVISVTPWAPAAACLQALDVVCAFLTGVRKVKRKSLVIDTAEERPRRTLRLLLTLCRCFAGVRTAPVWWSVWSYDRRGTAMPVRSCECREPLCHVVPVLVSPELNLISPTNSFKC